MDILLLYSEIRRNMALEKAASTEWQRQYYREVAEALTRAANALGAGRRVTFWSRLATNFSLFLTTLRGRRSS